MIVALDGKTQEINQISQGRMGDSIVCRQAYGRKARGKYGTDGGMGFHAHGKAQNKEATFFGFPSDTETTGVNQHERTSNRFGILRSCTGLQLHTQSYGTQEETEQRSRRW